MQSKVLFISHEASRTGAPIVLLNFLRWFKENTDIPFKILLRNGGPLEGDFTKLAPTMTNQDCRTLTQRTTRRLGLWHPEKQLSKFLSTDDIGLIYSNTITNHTVLSQLSSFLQCPVISHIHELEYVIYLMAGDQFQTTKTLTTHFIAVSNAVKENLVRNHHIAEERIDTVYEFISTDSIKITDALSKRDDIRNQLNIPSDAFVVGASGTLDWRKGPDLFIQLAQTVRRYYPDAPIYFLWVGGDELGESIQHFRLRYDLQRLNLENTVHFVGAKPNPLDYFAAYDVFALLSREDPYPLVCLEAALLEKPILCFDSSGGEKEFVEEDCGYTIPYLDLETTAAKINLLFESPELMERMGKRAAQKVRERHEIGTSASQITQIIKRFL